MYCVVHVCPNVTKDNWWNIGFNLVLLYLCLPLVAIEYKHTVLSKTTESFEHVCPISDPATNTLRPDEILVEMDMRYTREDWERISSG